MMECLAFIVHVVDAALPNRLTMACHGVDRGEISFPKTVGGRAVLLRRTKKRIAKMINHWADANRSGSLFAKKGQTAVMHRI